MEDRPDRTWLIAGFAAAALALLALVGIWTHAPAIERDLETRAAAALAAAGISSAAVAADGRTVTLTGPARDDAARDAAIAAAAVFGVRNVVAAFGAPAGRDGAAADGYRFQADWDGATLTLSGFMPALEEQQSLVAYARDVFPGARIANGVRVRPAPPVENWPDAAKGGLRALGALVRGALVIEGAAVTLSGTATDELARSAAVDLLSGLPEPYEMLVDIHVGDAAAAPRPAAAYRFGAAFDGRTLALSGVLPSAAARTALKDALAAARRGLVIDDRTAIDDDAPDGAFADAAAAMLRPLVARAESGTLAIEGRTLSVAAIARDAEGQTAILAGLDDIPAAYDWRAEIGIAGGAPPEPRQSAGDSPVRQCQAAMSAALAADPIVFASSSAALPDAATRLVDALAAAAATCPQARIEIAGHTDASGDAGRNVTLSERRAAAVEAALIVRGVDAARLSAIGHGASRPVAGNDTDEGKARNRRIEVIVRP